MGAFSSFVLITISTAAIFTTVGQDIVFKAGIVLYSIIFISLFIIAEEAIRFPLFKSVRARQKKLARKAIVLFSWSESKKEESIRIFNSRISGERTENCVKREISATQLGFSPGDYISDIDLYEHSCLVRRDAIGKVRIRKGVGSQLQHQDPVFDLWITKQTHDRKVESLLNQMSRMVILDHNPIFIEPQYRESSPFFYYFNHLRESAESAIKNGNVHQVENSLLEAYNITLAAERTATILDISEFPDEIRDEITTFYRSCAAQCEDSNSPELNNRLLIYLEQTNKALKRNRSGSGSEDQDSTSPLTIKSIKEIIERIRE